MNSQVLDESQINKLKQIFSSEKGVLVAYIFGSASTGKLREDSDIDLAIVKNANSSINEYYFLNQTDISIIVPNLHLSVVSLKNTSPLFLKQIINGVRIYEKEKTFKLLLRQKL